MDYVVNTTKLYKGNYEQKWTYVNQAEEIAANFLAKHKKWMIESYSRGNVPEYDVIMNSQKIEIKFQGSNKLNIEYATAAGEMSGIMLTHSKYYLMFNTGKSQHDGHWVDVGKVRLIKTSDLKKAFLKKLLAGQCTTYHPAEGTNEPGSRVVHINPKDDLPGYTDGWFADIKYTINANNEIEYHFADIPNIKPQGTGTVPVDSLIVM